MRAPSPENARLLETVDLAVTVYSRRGAMVNKHGIADEIHAAIVHARSQPKPGSKRAEHEADRLIRRNTRSETCPAFTERELARAIGVREISIEDYARLAGDIPSGSEEILNRTMAVIQQSATTPRQRACILLRAQLVTVNSIAERLDISPSSVRRALVLGYDAVEQAMNAHLYGWWPSPAEMRDMLIEAFGWRGYGLAGID